MYNRYIPNGTAYTRVPEEDAPPFRTPGPSPHSAQTQPGPQQGERGPQRAAWQDGPPHEASGPDPAPGPEPNHGQRQPPPAWGTPAGGGKKNSWLSGLLKNFKLDDLDTGDILLLLIILFLFIDGDDLELVITLGLLLLFGLGGKKEKPEAET